MGTAIVAIPAEDDYVWKVSSEKVPHLTILFLGETTDEQNKLIAEQLAHVADVSLNRFGLSVDRRGDLGDENADVLFFRKRQWDIREVRQARTYLLANDTIKTAYDSTPQFEGWTPHLTLGYPETPAKPDNRDYPGFTYVNFDRLALWVGDYVGPEFELKDYYLDSDFAMSENTSLDEVLAHYGVKGMHWGVRRTRSEIDSAKTTSGRRGLGLHKIRPPTSEDAKTAAGHKKTVKKGGTKALSNKELQSLVTRMNLEQQYSKLSAQNSKKRKGSKYVSDFMTDVGKDVVSDLLKESAKYQAKNWRNGRSGSDSRRKHHATQVTVNELGQKLKELN